MALAPDPRSGTPESPPTVEQLDAPVGQAIAPLNVTALVVTKTDLIAALRIYVPQLADLAPLDADRYLLSVAPLAPGADGG